MTRNFAAWAAIGLLGLFAALTFWLDSVVQPPPPKRDGSTRHDPDIIVENFSALQLGEDGQPRFALAAIRMTHYPDDETTLLERPHFTRFSSTTAPLHALSQRGTVSKDGEATDLYDNVQVIREAYDSKSEMVLRTSSLHIIPDKELAMTDKPVTIDDAHTHMTGVGLKLDSKTRQFKLLSRVKVRYEKPSK
jgi:lipopolysaccharide export system protein LptC